MNKSLKRILLALLSLLVLVPAAFIVRYETTKPSPKEKLIADLKEYARILYFDYPYITGFIPELADFKGGTLPLLADDGFETHKLYEKYDVMKRLTDFIPEVEKQGLSLFGKRYKNENVIIQSSAGRYHFSKSGNSLTIPSGVTYQASDYLTLQQIENHIVDVNISKQEVNTEWGAPVLTETGGTNEICTYNNGVKVTFANNKVTSIDYKGL